MTAEQPAAAPRPPEREQQLGQQIAAAVYEGTSGLGESQWGVEQTIDAVLPVVRAAVADAETRARQVAELLDIANETSNRSEAERARTASRAEEVEAELIAERQRADRAEKLAADLGARVIELETATASAPSPDREQGDGVIVRPEEYTVTAVPDDASPDAHVWALTVRHRGGDRWAVQRGEHSCLGADGTWAQGVKEYDRGDQWLNEHRFDLDTALRLARQAAPHVTVNGRSVADVLARRQDGAQR